MGEISCSPRGEESTVTHTLQKLLENKKVQILLAVILVLVALRLYAPAAPQPESTALSAARGASLQTIAVQSSLQEYQRALETELAAHLAHIAGAGQVSVMVTLQSSGIQEFAMVKEETRRSTATEGPGDTRVETSVEETRSSQPAMLRGGGVEDGLKLRETMPQVQGVVVVASGAHAARVREMLTEAVVTILALPPHRVTVLPGR